MKKILNASTIASILMDLLPTERKKIDAMCIPHKGDLGDAFEGLSQLISDILCQQTSNDIRVVKGQISFGGKISNQIDRMIVIGSGTEMGPNTNKFEYDINQVLAIIEVKKTLNKTELKSSLRLIGKLRADFEEFVNKSDKYPKWAIESATERFSRMIDFLKLRDRGEGILEVITQRLGRDLVFEEIAPLMIVHGFDGYSTKSGFASAFSDVIEETGSDGRSFWRVPNLTICDEMYITKNGYYPFVFGDSDTAQIALGGRHSLQVLALCIWNKIKRSGLLRDECTFDNNILREFKPIYGFNVDFSSMGKHNDEYYNVGSRYREIENESYFDYDDTPNPFIKVNSSFKKLFSFRLQKSNCFSDDFEDVVRRFSKKFGHAATGAALSAAKNIKGFSDNDYLSRLANGVSFFNYHGVMVYCESNDLMMSRIKLFWLSGVLEEFVFLKFTKEPFGFFSEWEVANAIGFEAGLSSITPLSLTMKDLMQDQVYVDDRIKKTLMKRISSSAI